MREANNQHGQTEQAAMNPYEHSTVQPPEPDKAGRIFPASIAVCVVGAAIWICLIFGVYFILPRFRTIIVGFGTDIPTLTTFVMDYAGLLLPLIGIAAGARLAAMQSRRLSVFVLIWLPMILMVVLALTVGLSFVKPLKDLA